MCSDVLRCSQMFSDDHRCFWIFSRYSIDVLLMFSRCSLDVPRMIAGFFQDDHFKWKIQRNSMIPNYSMIPAIWWSPAIRWSPAIWWSIGSMDFDNPKVYGDTSITDGLVFGYICICTRWRQICPLGRVVSKPHPRNPPHLNILSQMYRYI